MVEIGILFLVVDVVVGLRRDASAADLLVFVHKALGEGLSAEGAGLAAGWTFVGMSVKLEQGLLVPAVSAGNALLFFLPGSIVENFLPLCF